MLTFYHAPWSRSSAILWLLEELAVPYEMELVDIRAAGGAPDGYRDIQPNKKVPAIIHDGTVVSERAAITIYLADTFTDAALAPAIGDPARAAYLSTLVYTDAVFDPAVSARFHKLDYASNDYSFGTFEDLVTHLEKLLSNQPYAAGDRFTAADTQLASAIGYTMNVLKALPQHPVFQNYLARTNERAACLRAREKDARLAAELPYFKAG